MTTGTAELHNVKYRVITVRNSGFHKALHRVELVSADEPLKQHKIKAEWVDPQDWKQLIVRYSSKQALKMPVLRMLKWAYDLITTGKCVAPMHGFPAVLDNSYTAKPRGKIGHRKAAAHVRSVSATTILGQGRLVGRKSTKRGTLFGLTRRPK